MPVPSLLALDIDGTILDWTGVLREPVREAVRAVAASGVHVVLVTGRSPWNGIGALAEELGLSGPQVTMQGALAVDPSNGEVAWVRPLPPAIYREALDLAAELDLEPIVGMADGHRAVDPPAGIDWLDAGAGRSTFRPASDLPALAAEGPIRVFLATDPERHRAVRSTARERFLGRASIVWSDDYGIEVLAPGTNKGEAIRRLARDRGLDVAAVAAVGDAANDTEMLRYAGRSAAMGGAPPEVRAAADISVPSSDENGLLHALAWLFPGLDLPTEGRARTA